MGKEVRGLMSDSAVRLMKLCNMRYLAHMARSHRSELHLVRQHQLLSTTNPQFVAIKVMRAIM